MVVCGLLGGAQPSYSAGPDTEDTALDLNDLEHRLEVIKRKEHSLRRALERNQTQAERLRARVIARGRAYYRATRGMPTGGLMEHAVRVERLRQGVLSDLDRIKLLQRQSAGTDKTLELLKERRSPLEVERQAAGRARDALLARRERERAFEMAFSSSVGAKVNHTAVYSAGAQMDLTGATFAAMRGRLPFPVPGRAEIERVKMPYAQGPGLVLKTALGTPVRAVFSGRVAFADEYPQYGKTVIVDHGHGYFTVSAGLDRIEVRVGDELPQSARLGLCGTSGSMSRLYFEIRSQEATLPPGEWLGI
jgi:septal ring factor EnvC (AmiA/AmiB activator)